MDGGDAGDEDDVLLARLEAVLEESRNLRERLTLLLNRAAAMERQLESLLSHHPPDAEPAPASTPAPEPPELQPSPPPAPAPLLQSL